MNQATALQALVQALEGLHVRYLIGGSVASSSRGIPRATMDTDLLVQILPSQAVSLAKTLGGNGYVDAEFAQEAVERDHAFNIIHMPSGHKFDIFPAVSAFHVSELERADIRNLSVEGGSVRCFVATAEDSILAKLRWLRNGGETSERQWSDITGLLVVNRNLDFAYLNSWAKQLGVTDLLERAIKMSQEPI
jgi:hypothetical protein